MPEPLQVMEIPELKTRWNALIGAGDYDVLCRECADVIESGDGSAYLAHLFRAASVWMSGERIGMGFFADISRGHELAGADPAKRADALYMRLCAYVHVCAPQATHEVAAELLDLAQAHPDAADRYVSGVHQILGMSAMRQSQWDEMLLHLDRAIAAAAAASPRAELERAMIHAQRALALIASGLAGEAHQEALSAKRLAVQYNCLPFAVDCILYITSVMTGVPADLPNELPKEPFAKVYWLLACSAAQASGGASPVSDPAAELREYIRSTNTYAFLGLADWAYSLGRRGAA